MENITEILKTHDYDFLRDNPMFGSNIMMLAVSGSRSYDTATDTLDLDIRGVSLDLADDMLMLAKSRNISHKHTDTHIFQFNSFLDLLTKGQPNTIELFGLKDEHYLYRNDVWKMLEDKKEIFLSQHILHRIKGYADSEFGKYKNIEDEHKRHKSQMHIIRLYAFGIEIASGNIITYREKEHDLLMDIRNGKFDDTTYDALVNEWKAKLIDAEAHTILPYDPNVEEINTLRKKINKRIICNCV